MSYLGLVAGVVLILAAVRWKINIGIAASVAGVLLAVMSGDWWHTIRESFRQTALEPEGFGLLLAIAFITTLGATMKVSGAMDELVRCVRRLARDARVVAVLLPSFTGLLSVPGASLFSAPLVDTAGDEVGMTQEQKAVANVFFRHLWFYIYPVYPAFILVKQTSGMPYSALLVPGLLAAGLTLVLTARVAFRNTEPSISGDVERTPLQAAAGALPGRGPAARHGAGTGIAVQVGEGVWRTAWSVLLAAAPLAVVLVLSLGASVDFSISAGLGVLAAVLLVPPGKPYFHEVRRRLSEGTIPGIGWSTVGTVAGVVFFSRVVINAHVLEALAANASAHASSLLVFSFVVPLAVGFATGSHPAAVGIGLPLLLPLVKDLATGYRFVALFYIVSLAGYTVSPAHVCLIGSVQCLKSDLVRTWRMSLLPTAAVILFGLALGIWWMLQALGPS